MVSKCLFHSEYAYDICFLSTYCELLIALGIRNIAMNKTGKKIPYLHGVDIIVG